MGKGLRWLGQIVAVAGIGGLAVLGWLWLEQAGDAGDGEQARRGGGPSPVEVASIERRLVQDEVQAVGTLLARESVEIVTEVAGRIDEVYIQEGAQVEAGEPLFILDQVRERADLREAVAERDDARARFRRTAALFENRDVPESQLDERRAALEVAEARVEVARSRLEDRTIRAPFDGVVGLRDVSPGAYVEPGTQLTTLDDLAVVRLEFSVPERFLGSLVPGLTVEARSLGFSGHTFAGTVTRIGSRVDPVTRSVRVQAEFDNRERRLRNGMFMTARLVLAEREALVVPEEAVLMEGPGHFVFAVRDGAAHRLEVGTGRRVDGVVEIMGPVDAGERVVVAGLQTVRDGADVRVNADHEGAGDDSVAVQ